MMNKLIKLFIGFLLITISFVIAVVLLIPDENLSPIIKSGFLQGLSCVLGLMSLSGGIMILVSAFRSTKTQPSSMQNSMGREGE